MCVHDRFHDGQPDPGSSVGPRPCLIYLIEFGPQIRDRFLRDRSSAVKDRYPDDSVFPEHPDHDLLLTTDMMDRIAQVIGNDLLDLKFISPNLNRALIIKFYLDLILFQKDL